jgi:hypothetical protein
MPYVLLTPSDPAQVKTRSRAGDPFFIFLWNGMSMNLSPHQPGNFLQSKVPSHYPLLTVISLGLSVQHFGDT